MVLWRNQLLMLKSNDFSELAGWLATVAIASLGGPISAVGAVLAGAVKYAQAQYEASGPARDLRRQVSSGIRQWAESEKFPTDQVNRGLALTFETARQFGSDVGLIAKLNFDPGKVSTQVLNRARAEDKYWGTEEDYEVAARAIRVSYDILIQQLRASEEVLLPAIQALRASIDDFASRVEASDRRTTASLDELVSALLEAGTVTEVMAYLRTRIADWDRSVWQHGPRASPRREAVAGAHQPWIVFRG